MGHALVEPVGIYARVAMQQKQGLGRAVIMVIAFDIFGVPVIGQHEAEIYPVMQFR